MSRLAAPLPFRTITIAEDRASHLGLCSPLVPGHHPDRLPATSLCGRESAGSSTEQIHDVECRTCLLATPDFMTWPGFGVHP